MTTEIKKRQHARYSPSQLDRLLLCCRFKWRDTDSMTAAGSEGTALHFSVETGDLRGLDESQRMDVQKCLDYMASLRAGLPGKYYEVKEPRLILQGLTHGHADNIIISEPDQTVIVTDYKFVRTEGTHDFQITTYAAACCEMLGSDEGLEVSTGVFVKTPVKRVLTNIVAPRLGAAPELHEYDAPKLLVDIRERITKLYDKIENPFEPPRPDPDLCGKCARAAVCPAINKTVTAVAPLLGLPLPEVFDPGAMVSSKDRALAHQLAQVFEGWAEVVKKNNTDFVKGGGEIPGFKLTSRSTGFKVPRESTLTALQLLKEKMGLETEQVAGALTLSLPELSSQLAAVTTQSEKEIKAQLTELLDGVGISGSCSFLTKVSKKEMAKLL